MSRIKKLFGLSLFDISRNRHNKPFQKWYYGLISVLLWVLLLPFFILQFLGLFLIIEFISRHRKNSRILTFNELTELKKVFNNALNYDSVRVKEQSLMAKFGARLIKSPHLGFVFLNTIHFSRKIESDNNYAEMAWLVHEAAHVSQYQKLGFVYMVKALRAQHNGGYHYQKSWLQTDLRDFNFEQQADIAKQHYLNLSTGIKNDNYTKLIQEIQEQKFY